MYETFVELLQKYDITTYRVAKETGIATSTFTQWKNGTSIPKQDKLQKIADYFGVTVDYLLNEKVHKVEFVNDPDSITGLKERIKELSKIKGISVNKLEKVLGFSKGYISKLGNSTPNVKKIYQIAIFFGVSLSYLLTGEDKEEEDSYLDDYTRDLVQFLLINPDYKALVDSAIKVKRNDVEFVKNIIDRVR